MKPLYNEYDLKDYYQIDTFGQVYKVLMDKDEKPVVTKMSPYTNRDGYTEYVLTKKDGTKKHVQAQRLVALTYLGKPKSKVPMEVNHRDGDRGNNFVGNLEWKTKSQNIQHSFDVLGKVVHNKGKKRQPDGSYI